MFKQSNFFELPGYTFEIRRHALAILQQDYPEACSDLKGVLEGFYIEEDEVLVGGGGESTITQRLRRALAKLGWKKRKIQIEEKIEGRIHTSDTHEMDHLRTFREDLPGVAIEIEWTNKDPFYDRDLENFRRLHEIAVISVGVIITRGESLQEKLLDVFREHFVQTPARVQEELEKKNIRKKIEGRDFSSAEELLRLPMILSMGRQRPTWIS